MTSGVTTSGLFYNFCFSDKLQNYSEAGQSLKYSIAFYQKYAYPFFEKPPKFIAHGHTFHIRVFPISFRIKKPLEAYYDSDNIISHYQSWMTNLGVFAELSYM